jgi:cytochrome c553
VTLLAVPRSTLRFTEAQLHDGYVVADWHPASHPKMPDIVAYGRKPAVMACGYCHLATGVGRPENASVAGLPAAYFKQQVADMRSGARHSAMPYRSSENMRLIAVAATDAEVAAAAAYFGRLRPRAHFAVVESAQVPKTYVDGVIYAASPGADSEPLGTRLIEMAREHERHERRDDEVTYVAYVPPGSVERGKTLATRGIAGKPTACVTCHGGGLRGVGPVPPIAGRSPSYLLRQLLAFQTGTRATPAGQPMKAVVAGMSIEDMIAAAAYAATRAP